MNNDINTDASPWRNAAKIAFVALGLVLTRASHAVPPPGGYYPPADGGPPSGPAGIGVLGPVTGGPMTGRIVQPLTGPRPPAPPPAPARPPQFRGRPGWDPAPYDGQGGPMPPRPDGEYPPPY
jgi:hypothetical protein